MAKICFCTVLNNSFLVPGLVLLHSFVKINSSAKFKIFYSSTNDKTDLFQEYRDLISQTFITLQIQFIDIQDTRYQLFKTPLPEMASAYLKLYIFDKKYFEFDDDIICFLDADMLILKNFTNIITADLDKSSLHGSFNNPAYYGFSLNPTYINTGFMIYSSEILLENLDMFFTPNITNMVHPQWDQNIVNIIFKNKITLHTNWYCNYKPSPSEINNWNIIHYCGGFKPWGTTRNTINPTVIPKLKDINDIWIKEYKELIKTLTIESPDIINKLSIKNIPLLSILNEKWESRLSLLSSLNSIIYTGNHVEGNLFYKGGVSNSLSLEFEHKRERIRNLILSYKNKPIKILEIGVNGGHSAILMLETHNAAVEFHGVDINKHPYTQNAINFLKEKYNVKYFIGDSAKVIPTLNETYDIIHIDGNHTVESARNDILNCKKLSTENTVIIMDDLNTAGICGPQLILLWESLKKDGYVIDENKNKYAPYDNRIARYSFS